MGLLSTSASITRYLIDGVINDSVMETVLNGLKTNRFPDIEEEESEMTAGWTSFRTPYQPYFDDSSFVIGAYFIFALRIDKKSIPPKLVKKLIAVETARHLSESGRDYVSKTEKQAIKEHVQTLLASRIPATPTIYDIVWNYEQKTLYFFSTQKAANEELETLFSRSFNLSPIRLFPYTMASLTAGLNDVRKNELNKLTSSVFVE